MALTYRIGSINPFINIVTKPGKTLKDFKDELLNKYQNLIKSSEQTKTSLRIDLPVFNFDTVIINGEYSNPYIEIHQCYKSTTDENSEYFKEYDNILTIKADDNTHCGLEVRLFIISNNPEYDSLTQKYSDGVNIDNINNTLTKFINQNNDLLLKLFNLIEENNKIKFYIYFPRDETENEYDKYNNIKIKFIRHDPSLESKSIMGSANFGTFYIDIENVSDAEK